MPRIHSSAPSNRGFDDVNLEPASIEEFDALVEAAGKISVTPGGRYKGPDAKFVSPKKAKQVKESARPERHTLKKSEKEDAQKKIGLADKYGIGPWTEGAEELESKVALSEALRNREQMLKDELDRVRKIATEELKSRSPFIEYGGEILPVAQAQIDQVVAERKRRIDRMGGPESIEDIRQGERLEFERLEAEIAREAEAKLKEAKRRLLVDDVSVAASPRPKRDVRPSPRPPAFVDGDNESRPVIGPLPKVQGETRGVRINGVRYPGKPDSRDGDGVHKPVVAPPPPRLPRDVRPARARTPEPKRQDTTPASPPPAPASSPEPPRKPDPAESKKHSGNFEVVDAPNTERPGYMIARTDGPVSSKPYLGGEWGKHDLFGAGNSEVGVAFTAFRYNDYTRSGPSEDGLLVDLKKGFFAVVDGVGGYSNGRGAMELTLDVMQQQLEHYAHIDLASLAPSEVFEFLRRTAEAIELQRSIRTDLEGGAAVASMAIPIVNPDGSKSLAALTYGDTRVMVIRGGEVINVTDDMSIASTVLTTITNPKAEHPPSYSWISLLPGDRVVMCSDGITGDVPDQFWSDDPWELNSPLAGAPSLAETSNRSRSLMELVANLTEGSIKKDDKAVVVIDPFVGQAPYVAPTPGLDPGTRAWLDARGGFIASRPAVVSPEPTVRQSEPATVAPGVIQSPVIGPPPARQSGSTVDARSYTPPGSTQAPPEGPYTGPSVADRVVDGVSSALARRRRRTVDRSREPFRPVGYTDGSSAPVGPFAEAVDAPSGTEQPSLVRGTLAPAPSTSGQTPIVNTGGLVPPLPQDGTSRIVGTLPLDTARSLDEVQKTALVDEVFSSVPPRAREIAKDRGYDLNDPDFKDRFGRWFSWGERAPGPEDVVDFIGSLSEPTLVPPPRPSAPGEVTSPVAPTPQMDPSEDESFPTGSPWAQTPPLSSTQDEDEVPGWVNGGAQPEAGIDVSGSSNGGSGVFDQDSLEARVQDRLVELSDRDEGILDRAESDFGLTKEEAIRRILVLEGLNKEYVGLRDITQGDWSVGDPIAVNIMTDDPVW